MKNKFFDYMDKVMETNKDVYLLFVGLGWPRITEFMKKYPDRAINTEASEQTALDIAVGLAYAGKTPFVYTITPFLYRGFETIRTYINRESLNVKLIGVGRNDEYSKHDGFSHDATDAWSILGAMTNVRQLYPDTDTEMTSMIDSALGSSFPFFISIPR